jgi:hypothetical protein
MDTFVWLLNEIIEKTHGIISSIQLQALIEERFGVILTVQTLRGLRRSQPAAPRAETIQLLCDLLKCRSDAFYVFAPNPARAQQWAKDRSEGKKPSPLYPPQAVENTDGSMEAVNEHVQSKTTEKAKSLCATFTDPRIFFEKD